MEAKLEARPSNSPTQSQNEETESRVDPMLLYLNVALDPPSRGRPSLKKISKTLLSFVKMA